ncbi:MAG TPA: type II toxin-antitoxin system YafO family toxin [Cellvibrio sp.]|nr:type II toxin-antitoxin system YafO family toxin [Cellvibrio sp.]
MAVKIFTSSIIESALPDLELQELIAKFKRYKETNVAPLDFGRDAPYDRPSAAKSEELQHLHLQSTEKWTLRTIQFRRTSDTHLVYCYGWKNPSHYLLIAIIEDAHRKANNTLFMLSMAELAQEFRYDH